MLANLFRKLRSVFSESQNRIVLFFIFSFTFLFLVHVVQVLGYDARFSRFDLFSTIERMAYDHKLRSRLEDKLNFYKTRVQNSDVAIVSVDEASVAALGRFPFRRQVYAQLLEKLRNDGASVVAFDMIFSEAQERYVYDDLLEIRKDYSPELTKTQVGKKLLVDINKRLQREDDDTKFATAIRGDMPVILGMFFNGFGRSEVDFSRDNKGHSWATPKDYEQRLSTFSRLGIRGVQTADFTEQESNEIYIGKDPVLPIPDLLNAASQIHSSELPVAFFNTTFDEDGILRKVPLVTYFEGKMYPSLAFAAVVSHLRADVFGTLTDYGFNEVRKAGYEGFGHLAVIPSAKEGRKYFGESIFGQILPIERSGSLMVNFQGPERTFPRYELIDVLQGKFANNTFRGKIIFVGVTSRTLKDNKATPFGADFAGVEVHANIAYSILTRTFLVKETLYVAFGLLFLSLGAALFGWVVIRLNPVVASFFTATLVAAMLFFDKQVFFAQGIIIPTMIPTLQYSGILFGITIFKFVSADREKRFVETAFSRFVTGAVVKEILADHGELRMGGESRELTVLFADIQNFTTLSEQLEAQDLCNLLNDLFTKFTEIILDARGTLDKYIGDEIMCFWGAPLKEEKHAHLACRTALRLKACAATENESWQASTGHPLGLRIGINTGDMVVGNMGSAQVFDYTVIGDAVNLGSRLESVNRHYRTSIIVGEKTYLSCREEFLFRPLDKIQVMGKESSITIYELLSTKEEQTDLQVEWVGTFTRAREEFVAQNWDAAAAAFSVCQQLVPDDLAAQLYIERIEEFRNQKLEDWDGTWKVGSK